MGHCRLCREQKNLIRAHVIPEAFYLRTGSEPARIVGIGKDVYPRRAPIGVYDTNILCADCDNRLGRLDQEAAENLLAARPKDIHQGRLRIYTDANPSLIRDFTLSVLWRAAISTHYFFSRVSIGRYENEILLQLNGQTEVKQIGVLICEFDRPHPPFLMPFQDRIDGLRVWRIYASRFIFVVKTDRRPFTSPFSELEITENRIIQSLVLPWDSSAERKSMQELVSATEQNRNLLRQWQRRGVSA